jgi:hypothetical protein
MALGFLDFKAFGCEHFGNWFDLHEITASRCGQGRLGRLQLLPV